MKSITFITTGQPTTNPRLLKEAETLHQAGYQVKVICCFYQQWAQRFDESILARYPGMFIFVGGDPVKKRLAYFKTRLRQKICTKLSGKVKKFSVPENAISRTHSEALTAAQKIPTDLYIAHNLGALPAAVMAAQQNGAKIGFDAEDMYSGQFSSKDDAGYRLNKYIEEKYFPAADYFTAASELIAQKYHQTYAFLDPVVIDNVFPKTAFNLMLNDDNEPLKLFWFSQTVGADRGLEDIVVAMGQVPQAVRLHLVGQCPAEYQELLYKLADEHGVKRNQVQIHEPIPADDLFAFASQFDVGMATETGSTVNRDICLTNKIFTYVQSGLAVIASDTQGQKKFMALHAQAGKMYHKNDAASLAGCIQHYAANRTLLNQTRQSNYQLGQSQLNWEHESRRFIKIIEKVLSA